MNAFCVCETSSRRLCTIENLLALLKTNFGIRILSVLGLHVKQEKSVQVLRKYCAKLHVLEAKKFNCLEQTKNRKQYSRKLFRSAVRLEKELGGVVSLSAELRTAAVEQLQTPKSEYTNA